MNCLIPYPVAVLAWLPLALATAAEDGAAPSAAAETNAESSSDAVKSDETSDEAEAGKEKQKNAKIGMVFVAGIGFLGVFLIAYILIYGRRLRRQLNVKRAPSKKRDELWYLKSKGERPDPDEDTDA